MSTMGMENNREGNRGGNNKFLAGTLAGTIALSIMAPSTVMSPVIGDNSDLTSIVQNAVPVQQVQEPKEEWQNLELERLDGVASLSIEDKTLSATDDPHLQDLVRRVKTNPKLSYGHKLAAYLNTKRYDKLIQYVESNFETPEFLFAGLIMIESGGRKNAVSPTGATGGAQFTKPTARREGMIIDRRKGIDERKDMELSIIFGNRYLKKLYNEDPVIRRALDAYFQGGEKARNNPSSYPLRVIECALFYEMMYELGRESRERQMLNEYIEPLRMLARQYTSMENQLRELFGKIQQGFSPYK